MKKIILVILIIVVSTLALPAKTELLNLGRNTYKGWLGAKSGELTSLGLNIVGAYDNDFYFQLNFNLGMSYELEGRSVKVWDNKNIIIGGVGAILGVGHDFNFGIAGLILGGGLFGDFNFTQLTSEVAVPSSDYSDIRYDKQKGHLYHFTAGLGTGANFYVKLGSFVVNAGVMGAWNPLSYILKDTNNYDYSSQA